MTPKKRKTSSFTAFVIDQLSELGALHCRPMFGCYGLYHQGVFFAIICADTLFFRTDEESAPDYIKLGMSPFVFRERQSVNSYYEVPAKILNSRRHLAEWARTAVQVQLRRRKPGRHDR